MNRKRRYLGIASISLLLIACGGNDSPTSPSSTRTAQVAGVWNVTETLTSVSGGDCLGPLLQTAVGTADRGTMQIQQSDSSLTATFTSNSDGGSSSYSGTAGASTIALNLLSCSSCNLVNVTCPSGVRRDVRLQTGSVNATINGNSATGTSAETYNVFVAGTSTPVGILTVNASFSATKG